MPMGTHYEPTRISKKKNWEDQETRVNQLVRLSEVSQKMDSTAPVPRLGPIEINICQVMKAATGMSLHKLRP